MRKTICLFLLIAFIASCKSKTENSTAANNIDKNFAAFEDRFLDGYWKQYPAASINIGYGKYYDHLVIPDSNAFANDIGLFV